MSSAERHSILANFTARSARPVLCLAPYMRYIHMLSQGTIFLCRIEFFHLVCMEMRMIFVSCAIMRLSRGRNLHLASVE